MTEPDGFQWQLSTARDGRERFDALNFAKSSQILDLSN